MGRLKDSKNTESVVSIAAQSAARLSTVVAASPRSTLPTVGPMGAGTGGKLLLGQPRLRSAEISEALAHGLVECLGFLVHCCETLGRCTIGSDTIEVAFSAWMMASGGGTTG